jgi:tetratricopeptide (TPR) repeat protein/predicted Ser/Thr protein kinase
LAPKLECPRCKAPNDPHLEQCSACGAPLQEGDRTAWLSAEEVQALGQRSGGTAAARPAGGGDETEWGAPPAAPGPAAGRPGAVEVGAVLGGRYRIEQRLGVGGMGAVFKARDLELDRDVALKVIRPELESDREVLARFKQEIILAREITHRNVVRIFDLGQAEGVKFISMEFIAGQDLTGIIRERGPLPVDEATGIVEQMCLALDAAHQQGVVHRDLKPQNVMIDRDGRVVVMDFGIARSLQSSSMTQTGALLGTPDYMSPEQVKGEPVDARTDIFALGLIFYEMLTGRLPYTGDTPMATMFKRTQVKATPVRDFKPDLPPYVSDVIHRCLELQVHRRYQSAREILQDLGAWRGGTSATLGPTVRALRPTTTAGSRRLRTAAVAAAAVAAVVLIAGAITLWPRGERAPAGEAVSAVPAPAADAASLAILPFRNATGDPALDWLVDGLAEMLRSDVGQSASLRSVSSDRVHQILRDLRLSPGAQLEEVTLRRIAEFGNAETLVWGQFARLGEQIRIDATVRDFTRHSTVSVKSEAASEAELLAAIKGLAAEVRGSLAVSRAGRRELEDRAFLPSSSSIAALRQYNEGLVLLRAGNNLEAVNRLEASTEQDPSFALAHSKLAQAYARLGRGEKAMEASRRAVDLAGELPEGERYLILAQHASLTGDGEAGVDAYSNLLRMHPNDPDLHYELGVLYEGQGAFDQAREQYGVALQADPRNVTAQLALGRVLIKSGSHQDALAPLNQALSLAIQADNAEAKANTLQALGIAYKFLGRPDEALASLRESLAIKREIGDRRGTAASLSEIGLILSQQGDLATARSSYQEAIEIRRDIGDDQGLGLLLMRLGELEMAAGNPDQALANAREALRIQIEIGDEVGQAASLNNLGTIYDQRGEYSESLVYYQRALEIRERLGNPSEVANALHNIAATYTLLGSFREAQDHYLRALEQRRTAADEAGAALESFSLGRVHGQQGRYAAALAAMDEALEIFRRLGNRGPWYVEALACRGNALAQLGRLDEAAPVLEEALALAGSLGDDALASQALVFAADRELYSGRAAAAEPLYRRAVDAAKASGDPYLVLAARAGLVRAGLAGGRAAAQIPVVEELVREAQSRGTKHLATQCALSWSAALLTAGKPADAEDRARRALGEAENMGALPLVAESHHVLAEGSAALGRPADAARERAEAAQALEQIRTEAGDGPLARADLAAIAAGR